MITTDGTVNADATPWPTICDISICPAAATTAAAHPTSCVHAARVVFVAGQPGAGKTKTTEAIRKRFVDSSGAVGVCGDFYKPQPPMYGAPDQVGGVGHTGHGVVTAPGSAVGPDSFPA